MTAEILAGLKDLRVWHSKVESTGNIVRHCRYDEPAENRSTYVTATYRANETPIMTLRQGELGSDELPKVSESEFQGFDVLEIAWVQEAPSRARSLAEKTAPKQKAPSANL